MANVLKEEEYNLMRQMDTLHDFWSNQRGDDIQDILSVFPILKDTIKSIREKGGELNNNRVTLSGIENSFASYFERKENYPAIVDQNDIFTIDPTDTTENNESNLSNYLKNKAFQLVIPHDIDENYDLKYVGDFIREFMLGAEKTEELGFVIDANHGKLPQFFKTDPKVKTVINALVVADSANTPKEHSNSKFYERLTPNIFPTFYQNLSQTSEKATYEATSPFFSKEKVRMYYQEIDKDSFADNITAFKFVVETADTGVQLGEAYFSPSTTQGASVDTLKQLIQFVKEEKNMNELKNLDYPAKQLDIRPILRGMKQNAFGPNDIVNFLLDYKRAGDYEQVKSAKIMKEMGRKIIFSTGDELCALYARSQGVPCIYNHAGKMDLYAFNTKKETREDRLAKYTEHSEYYSKYKSFFNFISPVALAEFIEIYLGDLAQRVRGKIQEPIAQPFIEYSIAGYRNAFNFEVLKNVNDSLNFIISELDAKIEQLNADNEFEPQNYKLTVGYNESVNKIQVFLAVVDKIVEQINNITEETVKNFIDLQAMKIYESDNNIFNHQFDSHALLANTYTNFAIDVATEGKIDKLRKKKDEAAKNLANLIEKRTGLSDKRDLDKINRSIEAASVTAEKEGKALYNAELKYESTLMSQVNAMNSEIGKILQTHDENMNDSTKKTKTKFEETYTNVFESKKQNKVSDIVSTYQEFITGIEQKLNIERPMSITQATPLNKNTQEIGLDGGGYEKTKETIKLLTGLETALLTLSDYSETMFNALYKDYQRDFKEGSVIQFIIYLNYIYNESYKWKQEDDKDDEKKTDVEKQKSMTNLRDFSIPDIPGVIFETVKTDYIKYINELNGEFNAALNELMPPSSTPKEFYSEIAKILKETGGDDFIQLLYVETERDDNKRTRGMSGGKGEDIDLSRLFDITCRIDQNRVKRKFNNFDNVEVDKVMAVEIFVGGGRSLKRFATAARSVRSIHRTIKAFKNFKELKEHLIKETDKTNKKTQKNWEKIKELSKPTPMVEATPMGSPTPEATPMVEATPMGSPTPEATPMVEATPKLSTSSSSSVENVPDIENSIDMSSPNEEFTTNLNKPSSNNSSSNNRMEMGGGKNKKRTRKYKNKRNKKTRQQRKKTRKNKTLKKRREKGKQRTRRFI